MVIDRDAITALSRLLGPAGLGAEGASIIVDGMASTEKGIPLSEIQEVRINSSPYSAEFARPGRGRIEIITKSGESKYHGSLYFGFRDYWLDARNAFAAERPPQERRQLDADLSGPVYKDSKSSFSINMSRIQDSLEPSVYAFGLSGPILENATHSQTSTYASAQYSRKIGDSTLSFRYSHFDWSDKGEGSGGFVLPQSGADLAAHYHQLYSGYHSVLSPKLLNDFTARVKTEDSGTRSLLLGVPKIIVTDALTSGGAQMDTSSTDNRVELTDMVSWSHGVHLVKAGLNVPAFSRLGSTDRSNRDGTFYFSSLDDYAQGKPFLFMQRAGDGHVVFWQKQVAGFVQDEMKLRKNLTLSAGLRYDWQNYIANRSPAPRLSLAYAPGKSQKTVFRGGAGIFHDTLPTEAIADTLLLGGGRLRQIQLLNPGYPDPLPGALSIAGLPPDIVRLSPTLKTPYNFQYSFGVERQLRDSLALSASYTAIHGVDLFRSRDVNAPLPPLYSAPPDPMLGFVRQIESSGGMESHSLQTTLRGNLSRFFDGMVIYELGRAMNDTSGIASYPANNWDPRGEWGPASFDTRHFVYVYGTLHLSKLLNFGLIFSANSGHPYTITTGLDDFNDGLTNARPPGVARNTLRGTGAATLDLRWSKEFSVHGKGSPSLVAAVDAFNLLNRVNYSQFVGDQSSPFFGQSVSADPARRLQLSLTLNFGSQR